MKILTLEHALSLAAIAKVENGRRIWLRSNPRLSEQQYALTQAHFDTEASKALTQSLADTVARGVLA